MNRINFLFLIIIILFIGLSCSSVKNKSVNTIGISTSAGLTEWGWGRAALDSIIENFNRNNFIIQHSNALSIEEQKSQIRSYIKMKVDFIIIRPIMLEGFQSVITEMKQAKIPFIMLEQAFKNDSSYLSLIQNNYIEQGRSAGKAIIEEMDHKGNILVLSGVPQTRITYDRQHGFDYSVFVNPSVKVVGNLTGNFKTEDAYLAIKKYCEKYKSIQIDAVFSHNDAMAIGAIQAFEELGLKPSKDIKIISADGTRRAFELILQGKLVATMDNSPLVGPSVRTVIDSFLGNTFVTKQLYVEDILYTIENAGEEIIYRNYY